jgi:hypothetical protein
VLQRFVADSALCEAMRHRRGWCERRPRSTEQSARAHPTATRLPLVDLEARVTALETQLRELAEQAAQPLRADIPNSTDLVDKGMRDLRESVNEGFSAVTNALHEIATHQQRIAELIILLTGDQGAGAAF